MTVSEVLFITAFFLPPLAVVIMLLVVALTPRQGGTTSIWEAAGRRD